MKKLILFATSYPYTAGIIAIMWLGAVVLLQIDSTISAVTLVATNSILTVFIAAVGFRR